MTPTYQAMIEAYRRWTAALSVVEQYDNVLSLADYKVSARVNAWNEYVRLRDLLEKERAANDA